MNTPLRGALALVAALAAGQAAAQITFYERPEFEGRSFSTRQAIGDFANHGVNDRASSVVVAHDRWEVCEDARYSGRCVVLRPGRYPSLTAMGLNNQVSSVREVKRDARIDANRYAPMPPPPPVYAYRRRANERLYEANVTAVRAVVGPPEQRCWVEREQVAAPAQPAINLPAAIAGAVIGGVLGHQVGGGRGQDIATAGGAVAGAALGANFGRDSAGQQVVTQNVQRCSTAPNQARPDYWDVTYHFRGQDHRVQMAAPPGPTVTVNGEGEPRA